MRWPVCLNLWAPSSAAGRIWTTTKINKRYRPPKRIGVLADDLTGAGDVALAFERSGLRTEISVAGIGEWPGRPPRGADVWIVDTESRHLGARAAQSRVRRGLSALRRWDATFFYKKIDSTLRGRVKEELSAFSNSLDLDTRPMAFVPAFPRMGRTTRGGLHYVDGRLLHKTAFGRDPRHPLKLSRVSVLADVENDSVGWIPDIETQADLRRAAQAILSGRARPTVAVGSAGLAEELASQWGKNGLRVPSPVLRPPPLNRNRSRPSSLRGEGEKKVILVVAGSAHPKTRRQVRALIDHFKKDVCIVRHNSVKSGQGLYVVAAPRGRGSPADVAENLIRRAEFISRRFKISRMVATGGETAWRLSRQWGIGRWRVAGCAGRGMPLCLSLDGRRLVMKPGGFGDTNALIQCVKLLQEG